MMTHRFWLVLVLCLSFFPGSVNALVNQLSGHPSPYLALHGDDPVAWQDWSPAAVKLAQQEKKLIYISIGYFSCHWCHVMQQQSYKDEQIADLLNSNFIPVKVDRELEPALDARLIEFAQATQGRAGWPLNVFLTPDGHPLYAALYLPPQHFLELLGRLDQLWQADRENLSALAARRSTPTAGPGRPVLDAERIEALAQSIVNEAMALADTVQGGFGQSNKFPMAPQLVFLFDQYERNADPELREFLTLTLNRMAENGMYDHVGDGFFRYATDPGWNTPHFEKMLYDNAQLAALYLRASTLFELPQYAQVARRTLHFMQNEMADDAGAMMASFSAVDDQQVEGGYYLWQESELTDLLGIKEKQVIQMAWAMDGPAVFDTGYLPKKGMGAGEIGAALRVLPSEVNRLVASARSKLFAARSQRVLPVDNKRLAGWNGLALTAFAEAARITGDETYKRSAQRIKGYIMSELWDGASLKRAVDGGQALGRPSLEDYAYVGKGLWAWAQLTQNKEDYDAVALVIAQAWARFYRSGWLMAETSFMAAEPVRDLVPDGAMPSPVAVVADLSLKIALMNGDDALRKRTLAALNSNPGLLENTGFWYASHVGALQTAIASR